MLRSGVKRSGGQLVISVPKGEPATVASSTLPARIAPDAGFDALRNQVLAQAANMLQQMNKEDAPAIGGTSTPDLLGSLLGSMAPQLQMGTTTAGFKLEDQGDAYLLTSVLPEEQARNVSVNVDNERAVTITSKHEKKSSAGGATAFSAAHRPNRSPCPALCAGRICAWTTKMGASRSRCQRSKNGSENFCHASVIAQGFL
jgi:HSP20 family molecular chaperone IbpA